MAKKLTYEEVLHYIIEDGNGCILLSETYEGINNKMLFMCKCGNEFYKSFSHFKKFNQKQCPECGKKLRNSRLSHSYDYIKNLVESNSNCKLITKEYKNMATKMLFECECGREFWTTVGIFKDLKVKKCNVCTGTNFDIDFIRDFVKTNGNGTELISDSYTRSVDKLTFKCKCGEEFTTTFVRFKSKNKRQCNKCTKRKTSTVDRDGSWKRLKYEDVKRFIEIESNSGCKLLSEEYIGNNKYMALKCACGNDFETTYQQFSLSNKRQCNTCGMEKLRRNLMVSYEYVKHFIEIESQSGCKLVSNDYYGSKENLEIMCKCGKIFRTNWTIFKRGSRRACNHCSKIAYWDIDSVREYIEENSECKLISKTYIANHKNLEMKCSCGNEFETTFKNFVMSNKRQCNDCTRSKGEIKVSNFLKENNINFKSEYEFEGLVGLGNRNLRFDFAVFDEKDNVVHLIEYDGEFHFKKFFEEQNFSTLQIHDERKNQYCKDNNIPLLRIPYWEFDNIEEILEKELINHSLL